ncbi:MAG: transglutaminase domain-containing protein [Thermoplasmatota archaeon]
MIRGRTMQFSAVFRAAVVLIVMLVAISNIVDLIGKPHNYSLDQDNIDGDAIPGIDTDGDSLKDIHEDIDLDGVVSGGERSPTDPYDPDTDGDGILDGDEFEMLSERAFNSSSAPNWVVKFFKSQVYFQTAMGLLGIFGDIDHDGWANILDPDSDGDGILDGEELDLGLDPLDPDTDGDTIPDPEDLHNGFSVDEDGDGMDDQWEVWYDVTGPEDDIDGDGMANFYEFVRGSDPTRRDASPGHFGTFSINDLMEQTDPFSLVMTTTGGEPSYHRVATFSTYTGSGWERDTLSGTPYVLEDENTTDVRYDLAGYWWGDIAITSWPSSVVTDHTYPTFPGSEPDVDLRKTDPYMNTPVLSYTERVSYPSFTVEELSIANRTASIPTQYLQVPAKVPKEVWDIAESFTEQSGSQSPFILADHMARMIFERCQYSIESNFMDPSMDPVYEFLFLTKKGSALDYSSAFTIMMRMSGVPSRLVMGYALGSVSGNSKIFKEGHLHSWSEIYIEGFGWVPFEVTEHSLEPLGGTGVRANGKDLSVFGPYGGDGGGTLVGREGGELDPDKDEDNDGLSNSQEIFRGTDPMNPDTDGDDLIDGWEVDLWGTDPLDPDTDDDTLYDGDEVNVYGTDPTEWDTDGGKVSDGAEVYSMPPLDPLDPLDDYQFSDIDRDGLLNDQEEAFGTNPLDPDTDRDGLTDGAEVQSYRTNPLNPDTDADGLDDMTEVLGLLNWAFSDPSSNDTDGDGLDDFLEIEIGTDPGIFDTDNDGRGDGDELYTVPYTDPLNPDTDNDGLLDGRELQLLTSPILPDTDGDLRQDGFEFWSGTDPNNADPPLARMDKDNDGLADSFELNIGTSISQNDTDGDGLSDGFEFVLGSSPLKNDSDGDGVDDRVELFVRFTSLMHNDTDGDGLKDGFEIGVGTSPKLQDTDRDGLTDMKEMVLGTDPLDPDTDGGGIRDLLEVSFQKDPMDPFDDRPFPEDEDGDGLPDLLELSIGTSVSEWDTDLDGLSDGMEFFTLGTDPLETDTDGDGLQDGEEVKRFQTDPLDPDTDADGLEDGREAKNRRSSPLVPDTDGDGLLDGMEEEIGTGPRNPDTDGDGLTDGVEHYTTLTDPLVPDTDGGSVPDGTELEFGGDPLDPLDDPLYKDSDSDGLTDREEDIDGDGVVDLNETDPLDPDTDGDGVWDSYELRGVLGTPSDPLDPDTDDDSIWDGEELLPGEDGFISDPTLNDTDGDGLKDPTEVFGTLGFKSDPSSSDGDGDSLSDPKEVMISGTDPLDEDSDGDGLPDGWIDGWMGRQRNGKMDPGEFEDRNLNGMVEIGPWNEGDGPGETDPMKFDTDGGGVGDGDEVLHIDIQGNENPFDPLDPLDDEYILDTDGDGLTDMEENQTFGTNWLSIDTDSDGMADGYLDIIMENVVYPGELTGHNSWGPTDPLRAHSDTDGLDDGMEYRMGTDPNDPDTDQDGLYDGYDIADRFGELTGRNKFDPFHPYGPTDPLDPDTDGDGLWDGENVLIGGSFFYGEFPRGTDPNEPDTDADGLTDHFEFISEYDDPKVKWSDSPSDHKKTNPLDPDTDGGGMVDGLEVEKGMNPLDPDDDDDLLDTDGDALLNGQEKHDPALSYQRSSVDWDGDGLNDRRPNWQDPDTDGDGLTDGEEFLVHGTNPVLNDTDGDGLEDGEEVLTYHTDPLDQDSDDDGLSDHTEVTHVFYLWQSYVDWDSDGTLDNRTDPNNANTDLDADDDGWEVRAGTNPLDPGDPGSEYQPEKGTIVSIETAPSTISKTADPFEGFFKVTGQVLSDENDGLRNILVSILIVPRGTDPETVLSMERNPSFITGTASTDENGRFVVGCTPIGSIPHGEVAIHAVSRRKRMDGSLYMPSVSNAVASEVYSSSNIIIATGPGPYSIGSTIPFTARLEDAGGMEVSGSTVILGADWGYFEQQTTGHFGSFSVPVRLPMEPGIFTMSIEHGGTEFIGPSSAELEISVVDGPTILLEEIEDRMETNSIAHINGSVFGLGQDPGGDVSISMISGNDASLIFSRTAPLTGTSFSLPVEISGDVFRTGTYIVNVEYLIGNSNIAVNASLSFTVTERSFILLGKQTLVRGIDEELHLRLMGGDLQPLAGEMIRVTFTGSPLLTIYSGRTNSTGWATVIVPLSYDVPLGPVDFQAVHETSSSDTIIGGTLSGILTVTSETRLEIEEQRGTLTLEENVIINGRLMDDLGRGIAGSENIELVINGELVGTSGTDGQGFFGITHIISTFTPLGPAVITVRFLDLSDERAGQYESSIVSWEAKVLSMVNIQASSVNNDGNISMEVTLRDQNRKPVPDAQVRIGTQFFSRTYITDENGTLVIVPEGIGQGDLVEIEFPGDPERYLIPTSKEIIIPRVMNDGEDEDALWVYVSFISGAIAVVIAVSVILLNRFRTGKGSRRVEEARSDSIYSFRPRKGPQEMICNSYSAVLSRLREKGAPRPPEMTPDEYDATVRDAAPGTSLKNMEDMTRLFDEARYSDHEMSSHLISKAKTLSVDLIKEIGSFQDEDFPGRFERVRKEIAPSTKRHLPWKMKVDHDEDLKVLLGEKGGVA